MLLNCFSILKCCCSSFTVFLNNWEWLCCIHTCGQGYAPSWTLSNCHLQQCIYYVTLLFFCMFQEHVYEYILYIYSYTCTVHGQHIHVHVHVYYCNTWSTSLLQGGFAKCYELIDSDTNVVYAGKIVSKSVLIKPHQKDKVLLVCIMYMYMIIIIVLIR